MLIAPKASLAEEKHGDEQLGKPSNQPRQDRAKRVGHSAYSALGMLVFGCMFLPTVEGCQGTWYPCLSLLQGPSGLYFTWPYLFALFAGITATILLFRPAAIVWLWKVAAGLLILIVMLISLQHAIVEWQSAPKLTGSQLRFEPPPRSPTWLIRVGEINHALARLVIPTIALPTPLLLCYYTKDLRKRFWWIQTLGSIWALSWLVSILFILQVLGHLLWGGYLVIAFSTLLILAAVTTLVASHCGPRNKKVKS